MKTTRIVPVDISLQEYVAIKINQYEHQSREFYFELYDNNARYIIPENAVARVKMRNSKGINMLYDCDIFNNMCHIIFDDMVSATSGKTKAQLVLTDNETGSILVTVPFYLYVVGSVYGEEVLSTQPYKSLEEALLRYDTVIVEMIEHETTAKGYMENALVSEQNAKASEEAADQAKTDAHLSQVEAQTAASEALASEQNAKTSEDNSKTSEENALVSEQNAKVSEDNSKNYETQAKSYRDEMASILPNAKAYTDTAINDLIDDASADYNTLGKIENKINNIEDLTENCNITGVGSSSCYSFVKIGNVIYYNLDITTKGTEFTITLPNTNWVGTRPATFGNVNPVGILLSNIAHEYDDIVLNFDNTTTNEYIDITIQNLTPGRRYFGSGSYVQIL